jgi:Dolichyl-phosphate-mannose-protein mannosyltransferase
MVQSGATADAALLPLDSKHRPLRERDARLAPPRLARSVWVIAAVTAMLHVAVAGRYDAMRNELYFIVCGWHPDFGYVDQPPLVPLLAAATQWFGDNVWLLRAPATAAAVALVLLSGAFARMIGGDARAQIMAAMATAVAPGLAALTSTLTTSTFEPLAWTAIAFFVARAILLEARADLVWAGLTAGVALEAKWGSVVWLAGLAAGVAATDARRILGWRQLWIGIGIAAAIAAPNVIWQADHGWPFFEVILPHLDRQREFVGSFWSFELGQAAAMNILFAPLWLAGVVAPFVRRDLSRLRFLSIAFVVATAIYYFEHGTNYYLFPAYPTMFVLGSAVCCGLHRWIVRPWLTLAAVLGAALAPIVLPILQPDQLLHYMAKTGMKPRPIEAAGVGAPLTQVFSDELGWRRLAQQVATVYGSLDESERRNAVILASNYGEAAAIDVYGRTAGLPAASSGHNQYFLWGPPGPQGSVIIHVNGDPNRWRGFCDSVEIAGLFGAPHVMPYENDRPIFICRGLHANLATTWSRFKRYR